MSTFPPSQPQTFQPDNAIERAEAVKRLKKAWTSMIVSIGFSVLLLLYVVWRITRSFSDPALHGNNTTLLIICAVILARLAFNGYRLYNKWVALKAAQEHHRSFN